VRPSESAARALITEIHAADHALDVERFLELLTPTARFQIGSQPALQGRSAVRAAVGGLFENVSGVNHALEDLWIGEQTVVFQAAVTYTLKDRRSVCLPYVDVLRLVEERQVEDYRIFIDLFPLMAALAKSGGETS
jgi:hypothetical protein